MASTPAPTDQQLKDALAEVQKPEQKEIEIKLDTGEVFKGASYDEVIQKIAKSKEEASHEIRRQRDRNELLEQTVETLKQAAPEPRETPKRKSEEMTTLEWLQRWEKDPRGTEREFIKQSLAEELGLDNFDQLRAAFHRAHEVTSQVQQNMEVTQFLAKHPEFSQSQEDAQRILDHLKSNGLDPDRGDYVSVRDFEASYYALREEGKIVPLSESRTAPPGQGGLEPPPALPSGTSGGTGGIEETEKFIRGGKEDDVVRLLRQLGAMR